MTVRGRARVDAQYGLLTSIASEARVLLSTVSKVVHRCHDVGAAKCAGSRNWNGAPVLPRATSAAPVRRLIPRRNRGVSIAVRAVASHPNEPRAHDHPLGDKREARAGNQCEGCDCGYEAEYLMPLHSTNLDSGHARSCRFPRSVLGRCPSP
ncbi:hypothetical protein GCM10018775_74220 [Streptomyces umbrinus]|nr:hypothetical protein GCM10018775_74220 [Streptomyces umbrinus]